MYAVCGGCPDLGLLSVPGMYGVGLMFLMVLGLGSRVWGSGKSFA